MALISVIVPVYNVEKYIRRCLDSILCQSFKDFDVLLIDDGSSDNCPSICDEFSTMDSRVHVIHQTNQGIAQTRNIGLDWINCNSDSKWFTFIDSDDWVHPCMLEELYNAVIHTGLKISGCSFQEIETVEQICELTDTKYAVQNMDRYYVDHNTVATVPWAKLYQKSCFDGIRYPVGKIHEDEYVTYKVLFQYDNIAFCKAPMYYYFVNKTGITKSEWTPKRMDSLDAFDEQIDFFKQKGKTEIVYDRVKKCIIRYALQIQEIGKNPEYKSCKKYLRMKMRKTIIRYKDIHIFSLTHDQWIYELAYPNTMRIYSGFSALINKIRGIKNA